MQTRMQQAYDRIRHMLIAGELSPGARLVNRALGKELGLSTVTIREAIHRLTSEGAIEHIPNAGAFVRQLDRRSILSLYRLRRVLDCFAVVEAAERIDAFHLRRLEDVCDEWRSIARAIRAEPLQVTHGELAERWAANDIKFHDIIYETAANPWLSKAVRELSLLSRIAETKPDHMSLPNAARIWLEHARVVHALRKGDTLRAEELMRVHGDNALNEAMLRFQSGNDD